MLSQKRLKELLSYDPETGVFINLLTRSGNCIAGSVSGSYDKHGYLTVFIQGKSYKSHRLAYLYMKGVFPSSNMDHKNHIRDDNRWENLRTATHQENQKNLKKNIRNKSGVTGVYWNKTDNVWVAEISINGKGKNLGRFKNLTDAGQARKKAELENNFHSNHGV